MNIDGLGSETIDLLINEGLITDISDLYHLKKEDLLPLERMAEKSVDNLLLGLEASKDVPFERVLFGLGIRFVGETVSKVLVKNFKTIESLMKADVESLIAVDEIGDKIAESVVDYFSSKENLDLIYFLKKSGLIFVSNIEDSYLSTKLEKMKIVVSGIFTQFSRADIKKMIEDHGGKNVSSISKKTTFVLAGNNMGEKKRKKAQDLAIPILSEEEFLHKIKL